MIPAGSLALLGLDLQRPWALAGLGLAALVLVLGLLPRGPRPVYTGTFRLWSGAATRGGGTRRHRPPAARVLLALAIAAAALALAGPRRAAPPVDRAWVVVVDRSPSMGLPGPDGRSRLAGGVERVRALAAAHGVERLVWVDDGGRALDPEALAAPGAATRGPGLAAWRHDRPGHVLLTDRRPPPTALAGVVATGGPAVPGVVARGGRGEGTARRGVELVWDGEALAERPSTAGPRTLRLDLRLPELVLDFARAWAGARGWVVEAEGPGTPDGGGDDGVDVGLELRAAWGADAPDAGPPVRLARDGWSLAVRPRGSAAGEPWGIAGDGSGRALVARRPGVVSVAWEASGEPAGDPAAFALSWGALLDGACRPAADVVPLDERRDAGAPEARPPRDGPTDPADPAGDRVRTADGAPPPAVWLALAAGLLGLGAWALSDGGRGL